MPLIEERLDLLEKELAEVKTKLQQQETPEKTYSVNEAAELLEISTDAVNYHIRCSNLLTIGNKKRCKRISESSLNILLNKKQSGSKSPN